MCYGNRITCSLTVIRLFEIKIALWTVRCFRGFTFRSLFFPAASLSRFLPFLIFFPLSVSRPLSRGKSESISHLCHYERRRERERQRGNSRAINIIFAAFALFLFHFVSFLFYMDLRLLLLLHVVSYKNGQKKAFSWYFLNIPLPLPFLGYLWTHLMI